MKIRMIFLKYIVGIFFSVVVMNQTFAVVLERKSLEEISSLIDKDTLVFFDVDNTLISPNQSLGSAEWYYSQYLSYVKEGMTPEKAYETAQKEWYDINVYSKIRSVEPGTPKFVTNLQKKGIKVMGLTARPTNIYAMTRKQLSSQKIDLAKTAISKKSDVEISKGVRYTHGILFVNEQNKGEAMLKFLAHFKVSPQKVVFVDDVEKNTTDVDTALTKANITTINIRYSATDAKVKAYNPKIITIEQEAFNKNHTLISDAEAQQMLNTQS